MTRISLRLHGLFPKWLRVFGLSMVLSSLTIYTALFALDIMGLCRVNRTALMWVATFVILTEILIVIVLSMLNAMRLYRQRGSVWRWMGAGYTSLARHARNARNTWRLRGYPGYTIPNRAIFEIPKKANRIIRGDIIIAIWKNDRYWFAVAYGWDKHGGLHVDDWIGDVRRSYDDILRVIDMMPLTDVQRAIRRANATPVGQE